jgi:ABC-type multidrug transport system fused ATPase/permease subunit
MIYKNDNDDSDVCFPSESKFNTLINIILHVTLIFIILSLFFMLYASVLIKDQFDEQIHDLIVKNVNESQSLNKNILKRFTQSPIYDIYLKFYSQPDNATEIFNQGLFDHVKIVILALVFILVLLVVIAHIACIRISFSKLFLENIGTFLLVGIVEIFFFTHIALKYIPVPPSTMHKIITNYFADQNAAADKTPPATSTFSTNPTDYGFIF